MKLLAIVIIFLLLATNVYAISWSDASMSPPSGTEYNPNRKYNFQITWDAEGLEISEVWFEINTPVGTGNTTLIPNISNTYFINLTGYAPSEDQYSYRWFAMDNESNWNATDHFYFLITKNISASIDLYLNGTQANKNYKKNEICNFTAKLNIPGKAIFLDSDYPSLNLNNDSSIIYFIQNLTTEGFFVLNASWNGDYYYTGASKTYYFDVGAPKFSNLITEPLDYANYDPLTKYYFNVTINDAALSEVRFESNFSGSTKNYTKTTSIKIYNDSNNYFVNFTGLPAKDFNYRWFAKDDIGEWSSTEKKIYRVFKAFALILYSPFDTVTNGTTTVVNCYSLTGQIEIDDFDFHRNSTEIKNTTQQVRSDIGVLPVGFYQYICETDGNKNYSSQTLKANLTVLSKEVAEEAIKEFKITDVSSPTVKVGETGQGSFKLKNTLNKTVTDIKVTLSDLDASIYALDNVPSALLTGGTTTIKVNFDIPDDYEVGDYESEIRVVGKTDNGTVVAVGEIILTVSAVAPIENMPPSYSDISSSEEDGEVTFSFSLYDDRELSGYIFSINDTGEWINDSWTSLDRAVADISVVKRPDTSSGTVAWKVFMNDTDNAWSDSGIYYLERREAFNYTIPIVLIIVSAIAVVIFFIFKKKPTGNKPIFYVYSKEESEK